MAITIHDEPSRSRYELLVDGALAGIEDYRLTEGVIALLHTEVFEGHAGKGLAGQLVRHILDDARRRGLAVLPYCPYVRRFIDDHAAEYFDLVPVDRRAEFGWPT